MNCHDFQTQIQTFLNKGKMSEDVLEAFLDHAASCRECYDELEIYYILQIGLNEAEHSDISLNFRNELKRFLWHARRELDYMNRFSWLRNTIVVSAEILTAVSLVLCMIGLL